MEEREQAITNTYSPVSNSENFFVITKIFEQQHFAETKSPFVCINDSEERFSEGKLDDTSTLVKEFITELQF